MNKWTDDELNEFCEKAIKLLNTKKHLQLTFVDCWLFSNSAGSNFHIRYSDKLSGKTYEITRNGGLLQENKIGVDVVAELVNVKDIKTKIILRIAWFIYHDCKRNIGNK